MPEERREPTLGELLDDPIMQVLMERDGVDERDLRRLLDDVKHRRAAAPRRRSGISPAGSGARRSRR